MNRRIASWLACMAFAAFHSGSWAAPISALYAFGDSLSDSGGSPSAVLSIYKLLGGACDALHPCPPYYNGRFSNGPVAVEQLADKILAGGGTPANFRDFAVSGATSGVGNYADGGTAVAVGAFGLPGIAAQIGLYQSLTGGVANPAALYFLWGGANDILTGNSPLLAADRMAGYVNLLATEGAKLFLVPNLPDLGLTPFFQGQGAAGIAAGHAFSLAFNAELAADLQVVSALFPAADIVGFDTYALFNDALANPTAYGFTNVTDSCLSGAGVCANPGTYLSWDGFHPTSYADSVIASAFASALPEPGTSALTLLALWALLVTRGRRRIAGGQASPSRGQVLH